MARQDIEMAIALNEHLCWYIAVQVVNRKQIFTMEVTDFTPTEKKERTVYTKRATMEPVLAEFPEAAKLFKTLRGKLGQTLPDKDYYYFKENFLKYLEPFKFTRKSVGDGFAIGERDKRQLCKKWSESGELNHKTVKGAYRHE
jgi:hypothetical protein